MRARALRFGHWPILLNPWLNGRQAGWMVVVPGTLLGVLLSTGLLGAVCAAAERPAVYAVNYPLQYFAERIAGEHAEVVLPVPPGMNPAFWQPDAAAIADLQRADLILLNGAGYAKWLDRVTLPRRKLVNTSAGFRDSYIETTEAPTHSHGREGAHSHAGTAFTTWLDFAQAAEQAQAVQDALAQLLPAQVPALRNNLDGLKRDLHDLDRRLAAMVAREPHMPLLASHPVYQYLARRYGLELSSVLWEPDALPSPAEWQALVALRETHPADWMLWEAEPLPATRRRLEALGIRSAVFAPCGNRPEHSRDPNQYSGQVPSQGQGHDRGRGRSLSQDRQDADFLSVMHANLERLAEVFGGAGGR